MSGWTLRTKQTPSLRVDLRGVTPTALAQTDPECVEVGHGNALVPLAEFFHIERRDDDQLVFDADLARFDHVGAQMDGGTLIVEGAVGDHAGASMRAGELRIRGSAGALAACEMSGGLLHIGGNVGDFAAGALPGSMDGMRGGTLVVRGNAGARLGDRMRRGSVLVFGDAGDFIASRLVAGTIAVAGTIGAHPAYGMRRGTLLAAGPAPVLPPTFVGNSVDIGVFWQLLSRDLARHGGAFATLPKRRPSRFLGDLAAGGKGELLTLFP